MAVYPLFDDMTVAQVQQYLREHNSKDGYLITADNYCFLEIEKK